MVDDPIAVLRKYDARVLRESKSRNSSREIEEAKAVEWAAAWNEVIHALASGDRYADSIPDLTPLIKLAKLLKQRGYFHWLAEMAAIWAKILDDYQAYRPGQLWFASILQEAGKPRSSQKRLAKFYCEANLGTAPHAWRQTAAQEVSYFIGLRIEKARKEKADRDEAERQQAVKRRIEKLKNAATRHTAIEKQLFAVHWEDNGLRPAQIRDKWNALYPKERLLGGRSGRHDIAISINRGRAFLAKHNTTVNVLAAALGLSFAP